MQKAAQFGFTSPHQRLPCLPYTHSPSEPLAICPLQAPSSFLRRHQGFFFFSTNASCQVTVYQLEIPGRRWENSQVLDGSSLIALLPLVIRAPLSRPIYSKVNFVPQPSMSLIFSRVSTAAFLRILPLTLPLPVSSSSIFYTATSPPLRKYPCHPAHLAEGTQVIDVRTIYLILLSRMTRTS